MSSHKENVLLKIVNFMQKYYFITLNFGTDTLKFKEIISSVAHETYCCNGIEEFNLNEAKVDEILQERSYSGGDLPISVIQEVENHCSLHQSNFYFSSDNAKLNASHFLQFISDNYPSIGHELIEKDVQDWNEEWKKSYQPIVVDSRLSIIPSFFKNSLDCPNTKHKIYINPGMGFGTGTHETTFLCLKYLLEIPSYLNVLDFGCGSGILGISALKLNPNSRCDFCDISKEALENTVDNLLINSIQYENKDIFYPHEVNHQKRYDLVFANILLDILIQNKDLLTNLVLPRGYLILSGILNEQLSSLIEVYQGNNLKFIKSESKGDWSVALFFKE